MNSSECVSNDYLCDGDRDCPDGSDEYYCGSCAYDEFTCNNGSCIPVQYLCDGMSHCDGNEDEVTHCNDTCPDRWSRSAFLLLRYTILILR